MQAESSSDDVVLCEERDAVALLTFNRPQVLNAMNAALWTELEQRLARLIDRDQIKVIVFTGAGRAFSSGADLKESQKRTTEEYREYLERLQSISKILIECPKPTIAAINGYAIGSGYELALACDLRLIAEDAKIGSPEAKVESSVTGGGFKLLHDLVGPARAKQLLFTGEYVSAYGAFEIGLVNEVLPAVSLMDRTWELAQQIANNSALSIRLMKRGMALAAEGASLDQLMEYEVDACLQAVGTEERREKLKQFHARK